MRFASLATALTLALALSACQNNNNPKTQAGVQPGKDNAFVDGTTLANNSTEIEKTKLQLQGGLATQNLIGAQAAAHDAVALQQTKIQSAATENAAAQQYKAENSSLNQLGKLVANMGQGTGAGLQGVAALTGAQNNADLLNDKKDESKANALLAGARAKFIMDKGYDPLNPTPPPDPEAEAKAEDQRARTAFFQKNGYYPSTTGDNPNSPNSPHQNFLSDLNLDQTTMDDNKNAMATDSQKLNKAAAALTIYATDKSMTGVDATTKAWVLNNFSNKSPAEINSAAAQLQNAAGNLGVDANGIAKDETKLNQQQNSDDYGAMNTIARDANKYVDGGQAELDGLGQSGINLNGLGLDALPGDIQFHSPRQVTPPVAGGYGPGGNPTGGNPNGQAGTGLAPRQPNPNLLTADNHPDLSNTDNLFCSDSNCTSVLADANLKAQIDQDIQYFNLALSQRSQLGSQFVPGMKRIMTDIYSKLKAAGPSYAPQAWLAQNSLNAMELLNSNQVPQNVTTIQQFNSWASGIYRNNSGNATARVAADEMNQATQSPTQAQEVASIGGSRNNSYRGVPSDQGTGGVQNLLLTSDQQSGSSRDLGIEKD